MDICLLIDLVFSWRLLFLCRSLSVSCFFIRVCFLIMDGYIYLILKSQNFWPLIFFFVQPNYTVSFPCPARDVPMSFFLVTWQCSVSVVFFYFCVIFVFVFLCPAGTFIYLGSFSVLTPWSFLTAIQKKKFQSISFFP